ncbi:MAG: GNAT family N-acetyltransferase [Umezawaea sp.]
MKLVRADDAAPEVLDRARAIYEDGFPPHLRASFENLLRDDLVVLVDDEPIGVAVLRPLAGTGWVFLRYFVAASRGRGAGTLLWEHVTRAMGEVGHVRMVYDVEDPAERGVEPDEVTIRKRRIGFYLRQGARLLPVREFVPPQGEVVQPMLLMAVDLGGGPTAPIVGADLRAVVEAVYEHRYGLVAGDPVVRRTLEVSGLA